MTSPHHLLAQAVEIGGEFKPIGGYSPREAGGVGSGTVQFISFASNLISLITTVSGLMFLLYFILGGLNWITAGGDKAKLDEAKSKMTSAVIGLIVIVSSYAIAFIVGKVLGLDILNPATIINDLKP